MSCDSEKDHQMDGPNSVLNLQAALAGLSRNDTFTSPLSCSLSELNGFGYGFLKAGNLDKLNFTGYGSMKNENSVTDSGKLNSSNGEEEKIAEKHHSNYSNLTKNSLSNKNIVQSNRNTEGNFSKNENMESQVETSDKNLGANLKSESTTKAFDPVKGLDMSNFSSMNNLYSLFGGQNFGSTGFETNLNFFPSVSPFLNAYVPLIGPIKCKSPECRNAAACLGGYCIVHGNVQVTEDLLRQQEMVNRFAHKEDGDDEEHCSSEDDEDEDESIVTEGNEENYDPEKDSKPCWSSTEEVFLFGAVLEYFLQCGSLKSRGSSGKSKNSKSWSRIKTSYDTAWSKYCEKKNESKPPERSATAIARHYKVMKSRIMKKPVEGDFRKLYEQWETQYNTNGLLLGYVDDKLVISAIDKMLSDSSSDNSASSGRWTFDEEVVLIAAVMEMFFKRGSLGSPQTGEDKCWAKIKTIFDELWLAYSEKYGKKERGSLQRSTCALSRRYKIIKARFSESVDEDMKVCYLAWRKVMGSDNVSTYAMPLKKSRIFRSTQNNDTFKVENGAIFTNATQNSLPALGAVKLEFPGMNPTLIPGGMSLLPCKFVEQKSDGKSNGYQNQALKNVKLEGFLPVAPGTGMGSMGMLFQGILLREAMDQDSVGQPEDEISDEEALRSSKKQKLSDEREDDSSEEHGRERKQTRTKWRTQDLRNMWKAISIHGNEWQKVKKTQANRTYHQVKDKGKRLLHEQGWETGRTKADNDKACERAKSIARRMLTRMPSPSR